MIDQRPDAHQVAATFATPQEEWDWRIARSPFLSRQFEHAKIVRLKSGLQSTKRIQRLSGQGAGNNWAAITNTVGFIDPLHSTGIAHTLFSVSRLVDILLSDCELANRTKQLQDYSDNLIVELGFVDELVEGCYAAIPSFELWCQWGMLYFAAATSMEQMPAAKIGDVSFLRANDVAFRAMMREARERLNIARMTGTALAAGEILTSQHKQSPVAGTSPLNRFAEWLQSAIEPWNQVGLFDNSCNNLYSRTAAPADAW